MYLSLFMLSYFTIIRAEYKVGVGIADCTGPPTEIYFVYIFLKVFVKTFLKFVFSDGLSFPRANRSWNPPAPVCSHLYHRRWYQSNRLRQYRHTRNVSVRPTSGTNSTVHIQTTERTFQVLANLSTFHKGIYNQQNVIISGIHTHQTPGGYFKDFLYDLLVRGFVKQTFDYLVEAIIKVLHR